MDLKVSILKTEAKVRERKAKRTGGKLKPSFHNEV